MGTVVTHRRPQIENVPFTNGEQVFNGTPQVKNDPGLSRVDYYAWRCPAGVMSNGIGFFKSINYL